MNQQVTDPQPLLFFAWLAMGMLSLLGSIIWLLVLPGILVGLPSMAPAVIAWTHLMILGWLCSLFFAAGYQLTPVVSLNPLASRLLSRIHFGLHSIGTPTMVFAFASSNYQLLAAGGTLVIIGFVLFAFNVLVSFSFDAKWNHLNTAWTASIFWMLVGALMALLAVAMRLGLVEAVRFNAVVGIHIHTMLGGFFLMMLIAAASKLVPMFMLSSEKNQLGTWGAVLLLNLALIGSYWGLYIEAYAVRTVFTVVAGGALLCYYWQLLYFAKTKRRKWDAGMTLFYLANLMIIPSWLLLLKYHLPEASNSSLEHLRATVFTMTFLTFNGCILGMAQKIVPFMLWHHLYSKHLGKAKVPQTIDLLKQWTLWPITISYLSSAILFLVSLLSGIELLIRPATVCMLIAFIFVVSNVPQFVFHWRHPQLTPFRRK